MRGYDLEQANEAMLDLKGDRVRGSAVLCVALSWHDCAREGLVVGRAGIVNHLQATILL